MVILQVCYFISKNPGNIIPALEHLEIKLADMGHRTIYAFPEPARNMRWCLQLQKRADVHFLAHENVTRDLRTFTALREIYKRYGVDIVHSHFDAYNFPVSYAATGKMKIILHFHNALPDDYVSPKGTMLGRIKNILKKHVYRRANVISVSEYYQKMICRGVFNEKRVHTVPNGIVLDRLSVNENYEKKYDFLTFVSDFYGKGGDLIIDACIELERAGYEFTLLCCGGGRAMGWSEVDQYCERKGIKANWLKRIEVVDDVANLYESSRVFISASRRETFSFSICEAAYMGMEVLSSDIPGVQWAKELPLVRFFKDGARMKLFELMKNTLDQIDAPTESQIKGTKRIIERSYEVSSWVDKVIAIYSIN